MTEVFADAFFFIAFLSPKDQHHARVQAEFLKDQRRIVTTARVVVEVMDGLFVPSICVPIHRFIVGLFTDPTVSVASEPEWFFGGLEPFGRRKDESWSLTDCIGFAAMQERDLTHALTGDRHFSQAGFFAAFA